MEREMAETRSMTVFAGGGQLLNSNINGFGLRGSEVAASTDFTPTEKHLNTEEKEILNRVQPNSTLNDQCFRMTSSCNLKLARHPEFSSGSHDSAERRKSAFTLAETLIVLVILGVVASITVPALMKRQADTQNRAKIKKAMSTYDTAINKIVVENQLKSDNAVVDWAGDDDSPCANSINYFKVTEDLGNCQFKAADGVYWDISDILNTMIALKEKDLNANTANDETSNTFYMYGWFDNNGSLRVDDLGAATGDTKTNLEKLYTYINGKSRVSSIENNNEDKVAVELSKFKAEYEKALNGEYSQECGAEKKSCLVITTSPPDLSYKMYDSEGNLIAICRLDCGERLGFDVVFAGVGNSPSYAEHAYKKTSDGKIYECAMNRNACWEMSVDDICGDLGEETCEELGLL